MLIRISLIIAIIAGLAVAAVNFVVIKETITKLRADLASETQAKQKAEGDARKAKAELEATNAVLTATITELETTKATRDKAIADLDAQGKAMAQLNETLRIVKADLETNQTELATYKASGLNPEQALNAAKTIRDLEGMIAEAGMVISNKNRTITRLTNELAIYKVENYRVELPPTLQGKVLISDPKWNFVVLDVGEDHGVLERGELLVSRNGMLVGKLKVTSVQKDRSIANLVPGFSNGEVREGDVVIAAYPKSS